MKLIEAMKEVKANKEKITDLVDKIKLNCANLSHETPLYGTETSKKVQEWLQSCNDLSQRNVDLLCKIQHTNLNTPVTIELGGKSVTKSISEWVWRRREYALLDYNVWNCLTDRNLREGNMPTSIGGMVEVRIIRHFDPSKRDEMKDMFKNEPHRIDATLEVTNAVTDLVD